jgi:hypothetical protein
MKEGYVMDLSILDFIKGSWQGEGFVMDFTSPINTMVFGSMQAANSEGKTNYWEIFRFELVDDKIYLYTVTLGKDSGTYISTEANLNNQITFKGLENYDEKVQHISFTSLSPGNELTLSVSHVIDEKPYEQT